MLRWFRVLGCGTGGVEVLARVWYTDDRLAASVVKFGAGLQTWRAKHKVCFLLKMWALAGVSVPGCSDGMSSPSFVILSPWSSLSPDAMIIVDVDCHSL